MLRLAVQAKGRLYEDTMELLAEAGIKLSPARRTLLVPARNFPVEVLFLRDDDIPDSVASGVADAGIVGQNEFLEKNRPARVVKSLGFSKCRLSVAVPRDCEYTGIEWLSGRKIATSYPSVLSRFLKEKGIRADIHVITGSVEVAPGIGLADAIFDIVSSGGTLISNQLREVETVVESEAILISCPELPVSKKEILDELIFRIDAVQAAEDKKYILMNVPDSRLDEILAILPGIKSPTVMPLAQKGWSSVHTVIHEKCFWEIINRLRQAGAEGILVLNIEKMIK